LFFVIVGSAPAFETGEWSQINYGAVILLSGALYFFSARVKKTDAGSDGGIK
jgi:hypothetical protein